MSLSFPSLSSTSVLFISFYAQVACYVRRYPD